MFPFRFRFGAPGSVARKLVVLLLLVLVPSFSLLPAAGSDGSERTGSDGVVGDTDDGGPGGDNPVPGLPDDGSEVGPVGRISEALREDLEGLAEEEGISLEEAIRRYGWHNDFAVLAHRIQTAYPRDFSAAAIGDDKPWISFARKAPAAAVAAISGFVVPVRIVENSGFTEVEMNRRLREIHRSVVSDERITDAVSGYDIVTGVFDVTVTLAGAESGVGPVGVVNELREALPQDIRSLGLDIEFRVVNHPLSEDDALVGGGVHLSPRCTAGFVVENSSGVRNITTAGHCDYGQTIGDETKTITDIDFDAPIALVLEDIHIGKWGDVSRHSVSDDDHELVATFRSDSGDGDFRYVISTGIPARPDQVLKKYGRITGQTYDRVYKTNQCVTSEATGEEVCGVVLMHNRRADKGDSGGPWFWENTAYGIHKGKSKLIWLKHRDVFTPEHHIDDALPGWTVATAVIGNQTRDATCPSAPSGYVFVSQSGTECQYEKQEATTTIQRTTREAECPSPPLDHGFVSQSGTDCRYEKQEVTTTIQRTTRDAECPPAPSNHVFAGKSGTECRYKRTLVTTRNASISCPSPQYGEDFIRRVGSTCHYRETYGKHPFTRRAIYTCPSAPSGYSFDRRSGSRCYYEKEITTKRTVTCPSVSGYSFDQRSSTTCHYQRTLTTTITTTTTRTVICPTAPSGYSFDRRSGTTCHYQKKVTTTVKRTTTRTVTCPPAPSDHTFDRRSGTTCRYLPSSTTTTTTTTSAATTTTTTTTTVPTSTTTSTTTTVPTSTTTTATTTPTSTTTTATTTPTSTTTTTTVAGTGAPGQPTNVALSNTGELTWDPPLSGGPVMIYYVYVGNGRIVKYANDRTADISSWVDEARSRGETTLEVRMRARNLSGWSQPLGITLEL